MLVRLNNGPINTVKLNFVAIFGFRGSFVDTASLFIEISSLETEAKRGAIFFLFDCLEVNSSLLVTSELTNQNTRKAVFSYVVYTKHYCY